VRQTSADAENRPELVAARLIPLGDQPEHVSDEQWPESEPAVPDHARRKLRRFPSPFQPADSSNWRIVA